eukprot:TRINITY_DN5872_c0_g1_i1.p2 TRINITY_DN5872_c0_g1~~TRINITY_DN5872_c0_g1_i1.p2  ORF type:complete len:117 (-),score=2.93 TRINITY_DN5872_c0_g1_i1:348-698(-)
MEKKRKQTLCGLPLPIAQICFRNGGIRKTLKSFKAVLAHDGVREAETQCGSREIHPHRYLEKGSHRLHYIAGWALPLEFFHQEAIVTKGDGKGRIEDTQPILWFHHCRNGAPSRSI